jgi:hypothetical protein
MVTEYFGGKALVRFVSLNVRTALRVRHEVKHSLDIVGGHTRNRLAEEHFTSALSPRNQHSVWEVWPRYSQFQSPIA